jgi:hypothetical protein
MRQGLTLNDSDPVQVVELELVGVPFLFDISIPQLIGSTSEAPFLRLWYIWVSNKLKNYNLIAVCFRGSHPNVHPHPHPYPYRPGL